MAVLSITIPDSVTNRVRDGFCAYHNYQPFIKIINGQGVEETIPNPQTKIAFVKSKIKEYIKESVKSYEAELASTTAKAQAIQNVEDSIVLE